MKGFKVINIIANCNTLNIICIYMFLNVYILYNFDLLLFNACLLKPLICLIKKLVLKTHWGNELNLKKIKLV